MIYLDYNATTPCDPRVVEAMMPYYTEHFANAASVHSMGDFVHQAVNLSREGPANLIKAPYKNIFFTHGATEANNIVLRNMPANTLVIITNTEHSSVSETIMELFCNGKIQLKFLKIDQQGNININELEELLKAPTAHKLVSIISANNEIGTIHPLKSIGELCKKYGALFHTDATQAIGKIPIDVDEMNIDALSMSAHKIYGPKGIGALYLRNPDNFQAIITGGKQEKITSGTTNVPAVVGFAKAAELMLAEKDETDRILKLRNLFLERLQNKLNININGTMDNRLYNNLNISIPNVPAEDLVMLLDNVCISTGSACSARIPKPSHVITALGVENPDEAFRVSFGRFNTETEIIEAVDKIIETVGKIK